MHQRAAFFCQHQQAGGFLVQTMHEFEEFELRIGRAQLLNHAKRHARAAMYRQSGGFIHDQQRVILKNDGQFVCAVRGYDGRGGLAHAHGRNAHHIAGLQFVIHINSSFVHAHFAFAHHAIDPGFGHAFAHAQQKVVNPLSGFVFGYGVQTHADGGILSGARRRVAW